MLFPRYNPHYWLVLCLDFKERATKVAHFLCQTKLLKINPLIIDKCAVYCEDYLPLGADADVQIHTSTFKPVKSPDEREHLTVWLSTFLESWTSLVRGQTRVLLFSEALEWWPKIIFSCGALLDLTQVAVGRGHMQMQWSMCRMGRQWEGIMQGWITVDTWAAEALWMHKSSKCIKVWSGLWDYTGSVESWKDRLHSLK